MSFFFQKLEKNPHLHDKVEFNILFTCFDLTTPKRLKELKQYGFSEKEIKKIQASSQRSASGSMELSIHSDMLMCSEN